METTVQTEWEQSNECGDLFKALVAAQGEITTASRDAVNPFFSKDGRKASYATLAAIWDTVRTPLTKNGLCVIQQPFTRGNTVGLRTVMGHTSGQWMACSAMVVPKAQGPQEYGSVTSYLRRYALQAFVGVATEDDDGEGAEGRKPPIKGNAQPANKVKNDGNVPMANATQIQQIHILKEKIGGWTGKADHPGHPYKAALLAYKDASGKPCQSSKDLTWEQAQNLLKRMQGTFDAQVANLAKMNGGGHLEAAVREPGSDDDEPSNDNGEPADAGLLQNVREAAVSAFGKKVKDLAPQWLQKNFGVSESAALSKVEATRALQMLLSGDTL